MPEGNSSTFSIAGVVHEILPMQEGEGQRGHWQRQSFVIEVSGRYPYFVSFDVWEVEQLTILTTLQKGTPVVVSFDVASREYGGRWYTSLRAWRITVSTATGVAPQQPVAMGGTPVTPIQQSAAPQQVVINQQPMSQQQAVAYADTSSEEQDDLSGGLPADPDLPF